MRDRRNRLVAASAILALSGTACLWPMTMPALFLPGQALEQIDFEGDAVSRSPGGFEASSDGWTVADSPTAASGSQVLVRSGATSSELRIAKAIGARSLGGEVSVRVFLGSAGAGFACRVGKTESYLVLLEPEAPRVVLYRQAGETRTLLTSRSVGESKGRWARLGIRCEPSRVAAYIDGEPMAQTRTPSGAAIDLALYVEGGVVAQFDDLRYAARR